MGPCPNDVHVHFARKHYPIDDNLLDVDAMKVVRRLLRFGHEAYLVGGCVRDILLGVQPKDFDVVTSAKPSEVKLLFRNCRLIGRRFRLAHLHFKNQKIIEVATFRREPLESDDLSSRHAAQNLFGSAADDAVRRDFSINSFMYDIETQEIFDWVGGLADIEGRVIRAIGDPSRRLPEDPVRIIRAVKFCAKLDLQIDANLQKNMGIHAPLIADCSKARLIEEVFKILRCGFSARCFEMLYDIGALAYILPALNQTIAVCPENFWAYLADADEMIQQKKMVSDSLLLAILLYPAVEHAVWESLDVSKALSVELKPLVFPLQFTKKHMTTVRHVFIIQRRLVRGPKNRRLKKLIEREYAAEALALLEISGRVATSVVEQWRKLILARRVSAPKQSVPRQQFKRKKPRPPVKRTRTPKLVK